jgi:nicotinamidase-related amidase
MTSILFNPARLAVLSMDLQSSIVSIYAKDRDEFLGRAADVLKSARLCGATIIHVKVSFRPGLPEVHPRNVLLGSIKASPQHQLLFTGESGAIDPAVAPEANDIVVTKTRVSAFAGTDLALVLRAQQVDTLVMFGIATSGVVLSTSLHASDEDFQLYIVNDCCADADAAVHECLMEKVFPRYARVVSSRDVVAELSRQAIQRTSPGAPVL